ncbi:hypothetical protein D9Q98_004578 [Chlorella vulgaris]|uniref:Uncharacterized protein n=1 Tax=Chlorella vulgaris TaxID=3077 RepID=A0A9D4TQ78_CHLVU|nr:hypothetical protein D9Q98_004578 [Chlorella vulgaris]
MQSRSSIAHGSSARPFSANRQQRRQHAGRAALPVRASAVVAEHVRYLNEVAVVSGRPKVETLLRVLEAQGHTIVSPADRQGLHPLLIPLAQRHPQQQQQQQQQQSQAQTQQGGGAAAPAASAALVCLLRWPEGHTGMELPVVAQAREGTQVQLLARSLEEYLHRALAEDEEGGGGGGVAAAAGSDGAGLYEAGSLAASGLPSLDAYLARKAGMFPDVAERLALGHLAKGDSMSALITGEWYMRSSQFPGWGRPYEFNSQLMARMGRAEEARDVARLSLRMPWWSFADGYSGMRDAAGLQGGAGEVRAALEGQDQMSDMPGMKTVIKTDKQLEIEEADWLMNAAAAGETGWDAIRPAVADRYAAAGLTGVADFIRAA